MYNNFYYKYKVMADSPNEIINIQLGDILEIIAPDNETLNRNESFPAVSLSVKNPVSSKVLTLLVFLQVLSNIGILYFLYIGME